MFDLRDHRLFVFDVECNHEFVERDCDGDSTDKWNHGVVRRTVRVLARHEDEAVAWALRRDAWSKKENPRVVGPIQTVNVDVLLLHVSMAGDGWKPVDGYKPGRLTTL